MADHLRGRAAGRKGYVRDRWLPVTIVLHPALRAGHSLAVLGLREHVQDVPVMGELRVLRFGREPDLALLRRDLARRLLGLDLARPRVGEDAGMARAFVFCESGFGLGDVLYGFGNVHCASSSVSHGSRNTKG